MSVGRYGRRGRQWKARANHYVSANSAEGEQYAIDAENRARATAVIFGFCQVCGADVDLEKGRKHHPECAAADELKCFHEWERRASDGMTICLKCGCRKT